MLRDTAELLSTAVETTIESLDLQPEDTAAVQLARHYANAIDQNPDPGWSMRWIAPLLLDCLRDLGATPDSRARIKKMTGGRPDDAPDVLDRLPVRRRSTA